MGYFKSDGKYIYLDTEYAEFYVPMSYMDDGLGEDFGDTIRLLGLFNVGFFKNGKLTEMRIFNVPTSITLFVNDSETRTVDFEYSNEPISCKVIKYTKGNKIMITSVVKDSDNCEKFVGLINKGKLPPSLPYEKSIDIWLKNMDLNGVNLGVPNVIYELILSSAFRYSKDQSLKYGQAAASDPSVGPHDYVTSNIRSICRHISTFAALTYEDMDAMITASLNRTADRKSEAYTPIEDLLKL